MPIPLTPDNEVAKIHERIQSGISFRPFKNSTPWWKEEASEQTRLNTTSSIQHAIAQNEATRVVSEDSSQQIISEEDENIIEETPSLQAHNPPPLKNGEPGTLSNKRLSSFEDEFLPPAKKSAPSLLEKSETGHYPTRARPLECGFLALVSKSTRGGTPPPTPRQVKKHRQAGQTVN